MGAYIADTHINWHSGDLRTKEDKDNGMAPIVTRVELHPGDKIPLTVPLDVQKDWANRVFNVDAYGMPQRMAHYDERVEAPATQEGPPPMMLPIGPLKSGDFERMYAEMPQQPHSSQKSIQTGQHPDEKGVPNSSGRIVKASAPPAPVVGETKGDPKEHPVVATKG